MKIKALWNRKTLLALCLILMVCYYVLILDYPEEIVEIDRTFRLDPNVKIYNSETRMPDSLWHTDSRLALKTRLTNRQRKELLDLLESFNSLMVKNNIEYILMDGTLLGSYFFHDFIPWDDDLDLMVRWSDRDKLVKVFSDHQLREIYDVCSYQDEIDWYSLETIEGRNPKLQDTADKKYHEQKADFKFKFFRQDSPNAGEYPWKWPFIDIKFYIENKSPKSEGTISKFDLHTPEHYTIRREDFYPLHPRPFAHLWLPAPRDTRAVLKLKYRKFTCVSHSWDHVNEAGQSRAHVSCRDILAVHPHVHRTQAVDRHAGHPGTVESLLLDSRLMHSVFVQEPWHNVSGYYDLQ